MGFVFAWNFVQTFWITPKTEVQQIPWTLVHIRPPWLWKGLFLIFSESSPHSSICFLPVVLPVSSQGTSFSTSSYCMVADVSEVSPMSLFSGLNKDNSYPLLKLCVLHPTPTFLALCRTSFQCTYVQFVLGDTKRDTALGMWPHKCGIEDKDHFSQASGCISANSSQDADGHFVFQGHIAGSGSRCPPVPSGLFCRVTFSLPGPTSLLLVWDSSIQDTGLHILFCWTLRGRHQQLRIRMQSVNWPWLHIHFHVVPEAFKCGGSCLCPSNIGL